MCHEIMLGALFIQLRLSKLQTYCMQFRERAVQLALSFVTSLERYLSLDFAPTGDLYPLAAAQLMKGSEDRVPPGCVLESPMRWRAHVPHAVTWRA